MNATKWLVATTAIVALVSCGGSDSEATKSRIAKESPQSTGDGASTLDQTTTGFFYPIGKDNFESKGGSWLGRDADHESDAEAPHYFNGKYHNGVDMMHSLEEGVYAIADGTIYKRHCDDESWGTTNGTANCALFIEHTTHDGKVFTALYGHLSMDSTAAQGKVFAGKQIGKIGAWPDGNHLHFGIFLGSNPPATVKGARGWGMMSNSEWTDPCEGNSKCTNGFINPVEFIQQKFAYNLSTEVQARCQGDICWVPTSGACDAASARYRIQKPPFAALMVGSDACADLQQTMTYISTATNPREAVPENHGWQTWWRAFLNFFGVGSVASAANIQSFGTINTINVLTGNVVAGSAAAVVHGIGSGYQLNATEAAEIEPPDFVVKRIWLQTPWGTEVYKFGLGESFDTKAQAANIGDGSCPTRAEEPTNITGHIYLSKGYKEDPHSGDGAWRRIDSTTTRCDNLKPGDTNTETKNTKISDWVTEPGIYNVVYCIDHPLDDHNNGGEHREKHESNNCSTEAVFEVTANQIENVPNVDFVVSGLTVLQAPVYAGDYIRLGAWIKNQGTVNATADTRGSYTVSCNGAPATMLTDDGTTAGTLTAGASAWEEILTPVLMPNVSGTCTLTFTADYLGSQVETDETNNNQSITLTLLPRAAPNLVITRFEDKVGCCTTNTGAAPKPRIWIRNDGSVAPGANVSVVYQVSSPVATGGLYQVIGYGTIEPRELAPGDTDEDQMDCDGCWRIPKTSAWKKQWHNFRACLRTDGGTPAPSSGAPNPGEVCAVYSRYSKE